MKKGLLTLALIGIVFMGVGQLQAAAVSDKDIQAKQLREFFTDINKTKDSLKDVKYNKIKAKISKIKQEIETLKQQEMQKMQEIKLRQQDPRQQEMQMEQEIEPLRQQEMQKMREMQKERSKLPSLENVFKRHRNVLIPLLKEAKGYIDSGKVENFKQEFNATSYTAKKLEDLTLPELKTSAFDTIFSRLPLGQEEKANYLKKGDKKGIIVSIDISIALL